MVDKSSHWTIGQLADRKADLLIGTLSPRRVFDLYDHIRDLSELLLDHFGTRDLTTIALGVPERDPKGELTVNFPIFESLPVTHDTEIRKFSKRSKANKLVFGINDCAVGASLLLLTRNEEPIQVSPEISNALKEDISECGRRSWLFLPKPEKRYEGMFKRSWEETKPAPRWHCVYPIVLDDHVCAAFAVDTTAQQLKFLESPVSKLIRANIARLLKGAYDALYSHLDPPSVEILRGEKNGSHGLSTGFPWSSTGKVLSRLYLDRFSDLLDGDGTNSAWKKVFPDAKHLIVLFCDGDGIKDLNDVHGHYVGNEVIRMLGRALWDAVVALQKDTARGVTDGIIVRWAGDEFVVGIAVKAGVDSVRVAAAYCSELESRLTYHAQTMENELRVVGLAKNIGISVGWEQWPGSDSFRRTWQNRAEQAMYAAKAIGRIVRRESKRAIQPLDPQKVFMVHAKAAEDFRDYLKSTLTV